MAPTVSAASQLRRFRGYVGCSSLAASCSLSGKARIFRLNSPRLLVGCDAVPLVGGASFGFTAFAVTQVVTTGVMSTHIPPQHRGASMGPLNLSFFVGGGAGSAAAGALSQAVDLTDALAVVSVLPICAASLAGRLQAAGTR